MQKKTDVTKQHYYKISWITADDYAVHQSKEFHEKLSGATTGEELDINDGHDERQRKIYFQPIPTKTTGIIERQDQTVVFKSTEKVGSTYESDNKTMTSDLNVTFRLGKRMNSTQTHAGASAATLPVIDSFYLHDETYVNSNTEYTLLHRDSYENHENAGDASDPEILMENVFATIPWTVQFSKFFLVQITGMMGWQKAQLKKQKNQETEKTCSSALSAAAARSYSANTRRG